LRGAAIPIAALKTAADRLLLLKNIRRTLGR
jgi:hypothetical protein